MCWITVGHEIHQSVGGLMYQIIIRLTLFSTLKVARLEVHAATPGKPPFLKIPIAE